jgi:hypothetical protein
MHFRHTSNPSHSTRRKKINRVFERTGWSGMHQMHEIFVGRAEHRDMGLKFASSTIVVLPFQTGSGQFVRKCEESKRHNTAQFRGNMELMADRQQQRFEFGQNSQRVTYLAVFLSLLRRRKRET